MRPARSLRVQPVRAARGRAAFVLRYPEAVAYTDLTYRPQTAPGGRAVVRIDGRRRVVRAGRAGVFTLPARRGARIVVAGATARDPWANRTARRSVFTAGRATTPRPREPYRVLPPWR